LPTPYRSAKVSRLGAKSATSLATSSD
jgi:hypothetical protein